MKTPKRPKYKPTTEHACHTYKEIFFWKRDFGQRWINEFWRYVAADFTVGDALDDLSKRASRRGRFLNVPLILHELCCGMHEGTSWYSYQYLEMVSTLERHNKLLTSLLTKVQRLCETGQELQATSPYNTTKRMQGEVNHDQLKSYVDYEDMLFVLDSASGRAWTEALQIIDKWKTFEQPVAVSAQHIAFLTLNSYFRSTIKSNCFPQLDALWAAAESVSLVDRTRGSRRHGSSRLLKREGEPPERSDAIKMQIRRFKQDNPSLASDIQLKVHLGFIGADQRWQWPAKVDLGIPPKWHNRWAEFPRPTSFTWYD